jgi:hypothetical protein
MTCVGIDRAALIAGLYLQTNPVITYPTRTNSECPSCQVTYRNLVINNLTCTWHEKSLSLQQQAQQLLKELLKDGSLPESGHVLHQPCSRIPCMHITHSYCNLWRKNLAFPNPCHVPCCKSPSCWPFLLYRGESKPFSTPLVGLLDFWHIEVGLDAHLRLP